MQQAKTEITPARPVIFGEVLFDQLPDGRAVLGGAPFNVAWHLQGLGLEPLLISRVGRDANGDRVLAAMENWGMDTRGMQRDAEHPTGTVRVFLDRGQPSYRILPNQAYDHIDASAALSSTADSVPLLLYHGSLAARSEPSRNALKALRATGMPAFVDVNLRSPWWEPGMVRRLLQGARWIKLNGEELDLITGDTPLGAEAVSTRARALRARYNLDLLLVTEGEQGSQVFTPFDHYLQPALPADPLVDTVGAGDAFVAVCILGLAHHWPLPDTLARAAELATRICGLPGATPDDRTFYQELSARWAA